MLLKDFIDEVIVYGDSQLKFKDHDLTEVNFIFENFVLLNSFSKEEFVRNILFLIYSWAKIYSDSDLSEEFITQLSVLWEDCGRAQSM
jgi:hypothetical protein